MNLVYHNCIPYDLVDVLIIVLIIFIFIHMNAHFRVSNDLMLYDDFFSWPSRVSANEDFRLEFLGGNASKILEE